jgi:dipeptidyl aminopeptidase/acylaminoacyl peptidase
MSRSGLSSRVVISLGAVSLVATLSVACEGTPANDTSASKGAAGGEDRETPGSDAKPIGEAKPTVDGTGAPLPAGADSKQAPPQSEKPNTTSPLAPIAPREPHAFAATDLLQLARIGAPVVTPDASTIVFTLRRTDLTRDASVTDLWTVPKGGGEPKPLTTTGANESAPQISPDGKWVYHQVRVDGVTQVARVAIAGGEPEVVTKLPLDVGAFELAPDGKTLAVTMEVFPDCDTLECTKTRVDEKAQPIAPSGTGYDRLFARHWDTWKDGRRSHLFVLDDTGTPRDLTKSLDADVPSKPFGGAEDFTFSADGRFLFFSARDVGRTEPWSTDFDLFRVEVKAEDDAAAPVNLTDDNPAWDALPLVSPDGKKLAWKAMQRPGYESDRFELRVADLGADGTLTNTRSVTAGWDRSIDEMVWTNDSNGLWVTTDHLGRHPLFRIDLATPVTAEGPQKIVVGGHVSSLTPAGKELVFLLDDLVTPPELWVVENETIGETQITRVNEADMKLARTSTPEQFTFEGAGGDEVHAWVIPPVDRVEGRKYPVAMLIHGGPQGSFGDHFHFRWNGQVFAGAGYGVVMIDFHGSTGYGQAFTDAINGDWGGKPLQDLQKGLDAALDRYAWMDEDRVCALGASYGGYMINWIAGNWPDRFRCLVNHDGIFDQRSMYYSTEELWFPEWEHGGPYHERAEAYEKHNPSRFVNRWNTPMLVVHGSLDHRVPVEQGLATFTALQRRGIPSRLVHFPDENHWVLGAANSLQWHEEVLGWLDRWARGEGDPTPGAELLDPGTQ